MTTQRDPDRGHPLTPDEREILAQMRREIREAMDKAARRIDALAPNRPWPPTAQSPR